MNTAEQIVFGIIGSGTVAEWEERLPQRPDWQRYIQDMQELIDIEIATATAYMEDAINGYQKRCAVLEAQLLTAQESAVYWRPCLPPMSDRAKRAVLVYANTYMEIESKMLNAGLTMPPVSGFTGLAALENELLNAE